MDYGIHMLSLMPTVNVLKGVTPQGEPYSLLIRNSDGCYTLKNESEQNRRGEKFKSRVMFLSTKRGDCIFIDKGCILIAPKKALLADMYAYFFRRFFAGMCGRVKNYY
jgi:hypothetical protein